MDLSNLLGAVSADRMMQDLGKLARRVKLSGTSEERESLDEVRATLDGIGFATKIIEHEAFISLPGRAALRLEGRDLPCITHSMARPAPAGGLTAPLVFLGTGTDEDFARQDVTGKVVLLEGIAFEDVTDRASRAGAAGQIQISPTEQRYEMCVSSIWGSPGMSNREGLPRTVVVTVDRDTGALLRAACTPGADPQVTIEAEVDTGWRQTPILVAEMGCEDGSPFVMLSGHHDTWHHGVMDNGAANVTMLEIARVLATRRSDWARGLRLCFWSGHSHGRYSGSAWYADTHWQDLSRRCVAHVNVDSTGGAGADVLADFGTMAQLADPVAEAVRSETGQVHKGRRQGRAADQSFWGIGIASMGGSISHQSRMPPGMPVSLGWWWHTPEDLIEHVDPRNLARDTRVVLEVTAGLMLQPRLPLDHLRWCKDLASEIAGMRDAVGADLDLGQLDVALDGLQTALASPGFAALEDARANQVLLALSRLLIPLDHTDGDRFVPDAAQARRPWGRLAPLNALANAAPQDRPFARVDARRVINRFVQDLDAALALTKNALTNAG